ncbi:MAG: ImmA/IrrE family metallo-endopeptidase [Pyrinomonadaceae bacterium]
METGAVQPSFSKALKLAETLRIPFGYFYLSEPPKLEIPLPDFRSRSSVLDYSPSPDLLDVLFNVMNQHEWFREYAIEQRQPKVEFVGRFTVNDGVRAVATDIQTTIGVANGNRARASSWSDYLRLLVRSSEENGILVLRSGVVGNSTRRKLSTDEFQGFAISDDLAPLIFINAADFETAKIFTLVHELAHLWIGKTGISRAQEVEIPDDIPLVEKFCNSVAAEALVPEEEFLQLWHSGREYENVQKLARYFYVSSLVILRRAKELNLLDYGGFLQLLEIARNNLKPKTKGSGGNFFVTLESRNSPTLVNALVRETRRGTTTYREAANLLNMKVNSFARFVEEQGR